MKPYWDLLVIPIDTTDELINAKDVPVIFRPSLCERVGSKKRLRLHSSLALVRSFFVF